MSFTVDYNKARLANPGLSVDEFRKRQTASIQAPLPQVQPQVASNATMPDVAQPDYQSKLDNSLTKMGIDGTRAQQLIQNPLFKKSLYEMSLNQDELSKNPEYQSLIAKDKQRADLGNKIGQMQTNAPNALLALEDSLRVKNDIGNQPLGQSELFKTAGLDNIFNLQASLQQNMSTMADRYGSFTNALSRVSNAMANQYQGLSSSYKTLTDDYTKQYASLNDTLDKIAQHEEAMSLAEKEAELNKSVLEFKSKLESDQNKYQPVQDLIVPGQMWSFNKVTGQYTLSKVNADGTLTQGPAGGSPGSSDPSAFNTTSTDMRTDRHNNPTAFTTTLAKQAGLVEGVDYTVGDVFGGGNYTARLIGDPLAITRKLIDNVGFYTQGGQQRWTHTAMPKAEWDAKTEDQKNQVIAQMYQKEGGNGSLVASINQPIAQNPSILDQKNVVASTGNQGVRPAEFTEADVRELAVRMGGDYKEPKNVEKMLYQFRQTGAIPDEMIQYVKWGRPLSANELAKVGQMDGAGNLLTTLEGLIKEIPSYDATDLQSSIEAKAKGLYLETQAKWTGWPPEAAAYLDTTAGMASMFIRALGEVGTLSDGDVRRAKALIPQISDPTGVRAKKIGNLHKLFNAIQNGYSKDKTIPQAVLETLDAIDAEGVVGGIEYKGGGRPEAISILNANGHPVTEEDINYIINSK